MGVMSFGDTLPVWGGNTWLCSALIDNAIEQVGPKDYLLRLKESFDHGYNHADMAPLRSDELIEFRDASINWFRTELHGLIERGHIRGKGTSELVDLFVDLVTRRLEELRNN